ncbi:MAG: tetratricopeptide repeat protein [Phycisphaerae bacterium]
MAVGAFETATSVNPDSFEAFFNLAACHEQMGDPFRAMNIYRRLLNLRPDDPDCYANIGTCCIKLFHRERNVGWRTMAIEAWRHSLNLRPDQTDVREYLASCLPSGDE